MIRCEHRNLPVGIKTLLSLQSYIAITDSDLFVTPFNLSEINAHIVAGPALYQ